MRSTFLVIFFLLSLCFKSYAAPIQQCHKVVIAGNSEWPPYAIATTDPETESNSVGHGIGMDIAKKIFTELDIQVEEQIYGDTEQILEAARSGQIDVLVSTYKTAETSAYLQLLHPAYVTDHITIALPLNENINIDGWDSLVGLKGVEPSSFQADENIVVTINNYLHITKQPGLLSTLQMVLSGKYN